MDEVAKIMDYMYAQDCVYNHNLPVKHADMKTKSTI